MNNKARKAGIKDINGMVTKDVNWEILKRQSEGYHREKIWDINKAGLEILDRDKFRNIIEASFEILKRQV